MSELQQQHAITPQIKASPKCQGIRSLNEEQCNNDAKWEVIGLVSVYGAPHKTPVCDECLKLAQTNFPEGFPMIQSYNQYALRWRPIHTIEGFLGFDGKKLFIDYTPMIG